MYYARPLLWSLIVSFIIVQLSTSPASASARETFALGRNLDTQLLDEAIKIPPSQLIPFIESQGLKVYLYPSRAARNPEFAKGQMVPQAIRDERYVRNVFEDSGGGSTLSDVGIFIPKEDLDLGQYGTFLLIAESATSYTLLHEFGHFLFYSTELPASRSEKYLLQQRAFSSGRALTLQFESSLRLYQSSDVYKRENLVEWILEDMDVQRERVRWFVAEEVIVEALLHARIKPSTPYFNQKRVQQGQNYARQNIKGARVEVSRRIYVWDEARQSFYRTAGALDHTSNAEREEIVESIPRYQAQIEEKAGVIENSLRLLEKLIQ